MAMFVERYANSFSALVLIFMIFTIIVSEDQTANAGRFETVEEKNETDRANLNKQLKATAYAVQNTEQRLTRLEAKLKKLNLAHKQISDKLKTKKKLVYSLLAAMQRISRNPPPVIITHRSDALSMVRSGLQLSYMLPKFQHKIKELRDELITYRAVINNTLRAKENTQKEEKRLRNEQARLAKLIETKNVVHVANRKDLRRVRDAINLNEQSIESLSERILRNNNAVSKNTRLGAYELKSLRLNERTAKTIKILPFGPGIEADSGRLEPAIPFHLAKSQLPIPARGPLVMKYGDITPSGGRSNGIVIRTRHRAAVTSPCDGWIVYAGAFRSYGQLLIINAGSGYHVLLANLSRLNVQLGQFVLTSEPVGTMVGIDRHGTLPTDPLLLVEFRKNGKPIDPNPWWIKNNKDRMQS
ncbi:MAG: Murein hydrolase activator EnvC [Hyphomicrobiaceae bacterium hypho_1]